MEPLGIAENFLYPSLRLAQQVRVSSRPRSITLYCFQVPVNTYYGLFWNTNLCHLFKQQLPLRSQFISSNLLSVFKWLLVKKKVLLCGTLLVDIIIIVCEQIYFELLYDYNFVDYKLVFVVN